MIMCCVSFILFLKRHDKPSLSETTEEHLRDKRKGSTGVAAKQQA